jgi:phosphate transport system permease protein
MERRSVAASTAVVGAPGDRPPGDPRQRRRVRSPGGLGDRLFRGGARTSGLLVLAIMTSVGLFLLLRGFQALSAVGPLKFITTQAWDPDVHNFGIAAVLTGSVFIAIVAIVVAVPLALGTALFITEIARGWLQRTLISLVDLMAAVPSVVYGLWGLFFLQANVVGLAKWISTWFGWIPVFSVTGADPSNPLASDSVYTASTFVAGLTVALMVAPIACSIMREVFAQAPMGEREGAYALGATRWGMISAVVLPFGRGGLIGGTMLGLGRALGETIAVYMIISPVFTIQPHILQDGANSVSALIALRYGDSDAFGLSALMAAGLALFVLTLIVNFTASIVVSRSRSGAQSEV